METPNTTAVQIKAMLLWAFSALTILGVNVSSGTQGALLLIVEGFIITVLPTALVLADAAIRRARAINADTIARSKVIAAEVEPIPAPAFIPSAE